MNFDLVLDVVSDIMNQKVVTRANQLLVVGIIDLVSVNAVLDEEHRQVLDVKAAKKTLVLSIYLLLFVNLEQDEVLLADAGLFLSLEL